MNYNDIKNMCDPKNIFDTVSLEITISPFKEDESNDLNYKIQSFKINDEKSTDTEGELYHSLKNHCKVINERIVKDLPMKWKVFYLYKEIFQILSKDNKIDNFNYFRGQAKNWPTIPGIFRNNTSEQFINDFEKIYKRISIEFPNEIEHVDYVSSSPDIQSKRARQLAMLQHYGLRTSLLDLTRNPYIALLFMVSDSSKQVFSSGVIEAYAIDEEQHEKNNIFISVEKEEQNRRLKAQDGAFLYYDKLIDLNLNKINKIPRIIIELCYDTKSPEEEIQAKIRETEDAIKKLDALPSKNDAIKSYLRTKLNNEITSLQLELDENQQRFDKSVIFSLIHDEIKDKLNEYFYFEESLFPDLYKYIEFIQPKYISEVNKNVKLLINKK